MYNIKLMTILFYGRRGGIRVSLNQPFSNLTLNKNGKSNDKQGCNMSLYIQTKCKSVIILKNFLILINFYNKVVF